LEVKFDTCRLGALTSQNLWSQQLYCVLYHGLLISTIYSYIQWAKKSHLPTLHPNVKTGREKDLIEAEQL